MQWNVFNQHVSCTLKTVPDQEMFKTAPVFHPPETLKLPAPHSSAGSPFATAWQSPCSSSFHCASHTTNNKQGKIRQRDLAQLMAQCARLSWFDAFKILPSTITDAVAIKTQTSNPLHATLIQNRSTCLLEGCCVRQIVHPLRPDDHQCHTFGWTLRAIWRSDDTRQKPGSIKIPAIQILKCVNKSDSCWNGLDVLQSNSAFPQTRLSFLSVLLRSTRKLCLWT